MPKRLTDEERLRRENQRMEQKRNKALKKHNKDLEREEKRQARELRRASKAAAQTARDKRIAQGITLQSLVWPPHIQRTAESERVAKKVKGDLGLLHAQFLRTMVKMELDYLNVQWAVPRYAPDMAFDPSFHESAVVLYYGARVGTPEEYHRTLPMDRWTTAFGNLRAASKALKAMCSLRECGIDEWVRAAESMMNGALVHVGAVDDGHAKLPSKVGMATETIIDWMRVLEIKDADISRQELKAQYKALASKYHSDGGGGDEESFKVINVCARQWLQKLKDAEINMKLTQDPPAVTTHAPEPRQSATTQPADVKPKKGKVTIKKKSKQKKDMADSIVDSSL